MRSAAELKWEAINKTFLQIDDIAVLMDCGKSKALRYRRKFVDEMYDQEEEFKYIVPTKEFMKFYKIDIDLIRSNYLTSCQAVKIENGRLGRV